MAAAIRGRSPKGETRLVTPRRFPRRMPLLLLPLAGLLDLARGWSFAATIARARIGADRGAAKLGALWWLIEPALQVGAWFIFVALVKGDAAHPERAVSIAAAFVPWRIFQNVALATGDGYIKGTNLIRIPRLPRLALPLAAALETTFTSLFAVAILVAVVGAFAPASLMSARALWLLPLFGLVFAAALGTGLVLAALLPFSADLRRFIRSAFRILFFATPVLYSVGNAPAGIWRDAISLNPLGPIFECFRWSLGVGETPPDLVLLPTLLYVVLTLLLGSALCRRLSGQVAAVV